MTEQTKWCPRHKEFLPISDFYVNAARPDGISCLCIEHQTLADKISRDKKRLEFIKNMGGKCERCGFDDFRALQVDHLNGGGSQDRKITKNSNSATFYKKVLENRNEYLLLCANCNWIKKYENKEVIGIRKYTRQIPSEKKQGIGRGNSEKGKKAAANWWASATPEQIDARNKKMVKSKLGKKRIYREDGSFYMGKI